MSRISLALLLAVLCLPMSVASAQVQSREDATVTASMGVMNEIMAIPGKKIPEWLLADAQGIAIIPNMVKGGFVVGVRFGRGVILVRDAQGAWQLPQFITMTGGSVGFQAGVQATDVVLVFKTQQSVQGLLKGKFTIGADAAAAAGPIGRQAAAATDGELKAEIYSYSRSRGLFAGVSVDGSVLEIDYLSNNSYYRPGADGQIVVPSSATQLVRQVAAYAGMNEIPTVTQPGFPTRVESAPPVGNSVPPQAAAAVGVGRSLAASSQKLQNLVDNNWKRYLALPNEIYQGGVPKQDVLQQTLGRYQSVAQNNAYQPLTSRPEFQDTYQLLQQYVQAVAASNSGTLSLPAPPSGAPQ